MVGLAVSKTWETFARAPIVEAILDLRVEFTHAIEPQSLAECFLATHPHREEMLGGTAQLRLSKAGWEHNSTHGLIGYRFWSSAERNRLAQARLNGFTVNHLRPYQKWNALSTDGKALWRRYVECCDPRAITRVALRYVNRIVVPSNEDLADYLNIGVRLAGKLEQCTSSEERGYQLQLSYKNEQRNAQAIVRSYSEQPITRDEESVHILDVDVFRVGSFAPDGDEVWDILDDLRHVKNDLFFAATTDKAKETFR